MPRPHHQMAVESADWSETESLRVAGLESVGPATFGLYRYCLKTEVANLGGDFFTCHMYTVNE